MNKSRKEVLEEIAKYTKEADALLDKASALADEYGIDFYWSGPGYGMGGTYYPKANAANLDEDEYGFRDEDDRGWKASSQG